MSLSSLIAGNSFWIGLAVVILFAIYKWVLLPIMNEGKPIEPDEEDIKTFGEKMQESVNPNVDF